MISQIKEVNPYVNRMSSSRNCKITTYRLLAAQVKQKVLIIYGERDRIVSNRLAVVSFFASANSIYEQ